MKIHLIEYKNRNIYSAIYNINYEKPSGFSFTTNKNIHSIKEKK